MPASNNVKYRAVPRLHPPPSLGDSQSKTFGNSQTHPEPLHRIASLMRLSSPFWRRTKTPCMFAPLSSSTTASATVPQRATRLEKLLHEKSDHTGAIGSECQAGNENYDCGLSIHSLLLLSRYGPGGMALRAGPDAIPGARISLADDSQRQTTGHPSPMEAAPPPQSRL